MTKLFKNTCFQNPGTLFSSKMNYCPTHQASAEGLVWRNQKWFFISTKFRGSSSHFGFDHFYIVYFHSALTLQVSLQTNPHADTWWVGLYLFLKKMFFGTPYGQGCTNRCSLAAGLRGNAERMRKWRGNSEKLRKLRGIGEKMRKWRENEEMERKWENWEEMEREWGNGERMRKWKKNEEMDRE